VNQVRHGIGSDPRIGNKFLFPGVGFGGSCFPKDLKALISIGQEYGQQMTILQSVVAVNERQKHRLVERVMEHFGDDLTGRTFALWGLAFKPATDDMREAPSLTIVRELLKAGATVRASDPVAIETARHELGDTIVYFEDNYEACEGCDALLVVTEWPEFRQPDFERLGTLLKSRVVFDGRNLYEPENMRDAGFAHYSIGRPAVDGSAR
jgi:UDPglucose 6-dehydrogenase